MNNRQTIVWIFANLCFLILAWQLPATAVAQQPDSTASAPKKELLDDAQWQRIDQSVERSLTWLSKQQRPDGSFPTDPGGQPAVTALCLMAFASHGHLPGQGKYGDQLEKGIEYILSCQKRSGLVALECPNTEEIPRNVLRDTGNNAVYNHAIGATALCEFYGLADGTDRQAEAIEKAIKTSLTMQKWPKKRDSELGGWRYLRRTASPDVQSDLSVTAWQIMFLRSAKNSGFEVPAQSLTDGVNYVLNTYDAKEKTFHLFDSPNRDPRAFSRGMAGAGILALAHSGVHDRPESIGAAKFLLRVPCVPYGEDDPVKVGGSWYPDRYHYSAFMATQAMYQMGGKYWRQHFPPTVKALIENQSPDGSWPPEKHQYDGRFGNAYTTALVVLALGAPNQLLPIFQR